MLTGVDLSHHQNDAGPIDYGRLFAAVDFVLVKATQGTSYTDPAFTGNMGAARAAGALRGAYHFAGDGQNVGDPTAEADHFVQAVGWQRGEVLVLDWEPGRPPADPDAWCVTFLARVRDRLGIMPVVYMSEAVTRQRDWKRTRALGPGLWVARYGPNNGTRPALALNVGAWGRWALWQYTSAGRAAGVTGNVDLNVFDGNAAAWVRAGAGSPTTVTPPLAAAIQQPAAAPAGASGLPTLQYGQTSDDVRRLQTFLTRAFPAYCLFPATGFYGDQTAAGLKEFCRRTGVGGDGRDVGPKTKAALWSAGYRG